MNIILLNKVKLFKSTNSNLNIVMGASIFVQNFALYFFRQKPIELVITGKAMKIFDIFMSRVKRQRLISPLKLVMEGVEIYMLFFIFLRVRPFNEFFFHQGYSSQFHVNVYKISCLFTSTLTRDFEANALYWRILLWTTHMNMSTVSVPSLLYGQQSVEAWAETGQ